MSRYVFVWQGQSAYGTFPSEDAARQYARGKFGPKLAGDVAVYELVPVFSEGRFTDSLDNSG